MEQNKCNLNEKFYQIYLRKIKKWTFCPSCQKKMKLDVSSAKWVCDHCGFQESSDSFDSDTLFWYCEKCGAFLNPQQGFEADRFEHACKECGHNNLSFQTAFRICRSCGARIRPAEGHYCQSCQQLHAMAKGAAGSLLAMVGLNVAGKAIKNVLDNNLVLTMSDDELKSKRKELQKQYRYAQGAEADRLYSDMKAIDSELQRRALGEEKPRGPGYHREHGYNLMKDD